MWEQIISGGRFVDGWLVDYGDEQDRRVMDGYPYVTRIVSLELKPNGPSRLFAVNGQEFNCSGDVQYLGVNGAPDFPCAEGGLALRNTFMGHEFHILPPTAKPPRTAGLDAGGGE